MRTLTGERLAEIFRKAAELIERRGFTQHDRERTLGLTLDSAVCEVTHPLGDGGGWYGDSHPLDCDEATERLMGWMVLAGVTRLPYRVNPGNVVAAWSDERRRTSDEVTRLLRGAARVAEHQEDSLT